jgi:aryl carrier-like protein
MMKKRKGRPKAVEAKKQYTIMLRPSVVEEIDQLAEELKMTRSQLMSNLIQVGLDDARVFKKAGLFKVIMAGGEIAEKLRKAFFTGNLDFLEEDDEGVMHK